MVLYEKVINDLEKIIVSKKLIVIAIVAGLVNFTGAFALVWFTKQTPPTENNASDGSLNQQAFMQNGIDLNLPQSESIMADSIGSDYDSKKIVLKEKQFKDLIYEAREKIQEYNNKLNNFDLREQRLQITHNMVKRDVEKLNNLQIQLASTVVGLKEEREKLLNSQIKVVKNEKKNLVSIAAAYDKMDAASASKILLNISRSPSSNPNRSDNIDEAVKIIYYMTERTKAKLLAEMVGLEPRLAAELCQRLKQIAEKE